jgi:hypothetical protein
MPAIRKGRFFRYDIKRTWADYTWNGWYTQLTNFKDIYNVASQPLTYNKTYMGISLICQSWMYSCLPILMAMYLTLIQTKARKATLRRFDKQKGYLPGYFQKAGSS